jgi:hypothetical protein
VRMREGEWPSPVMAKPALLPILPLLLCAAAGFTACAGLEREPIEVRRGPAEEGASALAGPGQEALLPAVDGTQALLERLLARPATAREAAPPDSPDPRPLLLDLGLRAEGAVLHVAGHELPPAAAEAALSEALAEIAPRIGPFSGPRATALEELLPAGVVDGAQVLESPLLPALLQRARALGGSHLLTGRLERLEQERVSVYVPLLGRYEARERGRVRLWFELWELATGTLVCADLLDQRYALDGLSPRELFSSERLLARMVVRELLAELGRCPLEPPPPAGLSPSTAEH